MPQIDLDFIRRTTEHRRVGDLPGDADEQWAVVCWFYSAYHLVRHALTSDPIFDDPTQLSRINAELTPADRSVARHNARKVGPNGREWGVNELVVKLYRPIAGDYNRLHQASVAVRYEDGVSVDLTSVKAALDRAWAVHSAGKLRYPMS